MSKPVPNKAQTRAAERQRLREAQSQLDYVHNAMSFEQISVQTTGQSRLWTFSFGGRPLLRYWPAHAEAKMADLPGKFKCSSTAAACRAAVKAKGRILAAMRDAMQCAPPPSPRVAQRKKRR